MHKMLTLTALFVTSVVPGFADAKANSPRSMPIEVGSRTFNLRAHEKRINAHHKKMTKDGKAEPLSKEFVAVHQGMKKGVYKYDLATARKVMQELHANRMVAAPKMLQQQIATKTK